MHEIKKKISTFVLGKYVSSYPGKSVYFLITIKTTSIP